MFVFTIKKNLRDFLSKLREKGSSIGFVPTMGALHDGHLALIKQSGRENDYTVVSIFVNPTQFDRKDDLEKYPRTLERDLYLLEQINPGMIVYIPEATDLYEGQITSRSYDHGGLDKVMEGKFRPGHFDGVATVVHLLFDAVNPDKAYFGEKDFQQLQIIRHLVKTQQLPVEIVPVPIYREKDGLAMSSRNRRLTPEQRQAAPLIYKTMKEGAGLFPLKSPEEIKGFVFDRLKNHPLLEPEYVEIAEVETLKPAKKFEEGKKYRMFAAVFAGDIRLIDNLPLN